MKTTVETTIATRIIDAKTGKVIKERKPEKNLVLDSGLNALAGSGAVIASAAPNGIAATCMIGGSSTPNSTASGAITFTQATTTITASAAFFTVGMVGALFKYGTGSGGAEMYITAFTNSTTVTVGTSATVGTPTVATVWFVQQTVLGSLLFVSGTYQTNAGDCGTTFSGNTATHKRTFLFAQQASPYTVNEIGYARSNSSGKVAGRVVLSSSDVVGITNFYVVVISITVTYTPATPTAIGNLGININTAGTLALECCNGTSFSVVGSSGSIGAAGFLDIGGSATLMFATATYSQNGSPSATTTPGPARLSIGSAFWTNDNTAVGRATITYNVGISTTGQSLFGMALGGVGSNQYVLDILFTATQTAPTGTFQPNTVWAFTFTRSLVN